MSPEQIAESMNAGDESLYQYFWKLFFFATREYARDPLATRDMDLIAALFAADREQALKNVLAKELLNIDSISRSLEGHDGSTIISGRNKRALEVMRQRIAAGDRRIAIFYGAAHLSDLEDRLIGEHELELTNLSWLDAWDLGDKKRSHKYP